MPRKRPPSKPRTASRQKETARAEHVEATHAAAQKQYGTSPPAFKDVCKAVLDFLRACEPHRLKRLDVLGTPDDPATRQDAESMSRAVLESLGNDVQPAFGAYLDAIVERVRERLGQPALPESQVIGALQEIERQGLARRETGTRFEQPETVWRAAAPPKGDAPDARHSADFRSVQWFGTEYDFTATQAAIVKLLWEAWENDTPGVGSDSLLVAVDSKTSRLVDIFRDHPAWGAMIVNGATKGSKRLTPPRHV